MSDHTTREWCQNCNQVSPVGFHVPDEVWKAVAGHGRWNLLCIMCFALIADEKHIAWDEEIRFFPVSYATLHAQREDQTA